jgi:hypothetical protein
VFILGLRLADLQAETLEVFGKAPARPSRWEDFVSLYHSGVLNAFMTDAASFEK